MVFMHHHKLEILEILEKNGIFPFEISFIETKGRYVHQEKSVWLYRLSPIFLGETKLVYTQENSFFFNVKTELVPIKKWGEDSSFFTRDKEVRFTIKYSPNNNIQYFEKSFEHSYNSGNSFYDEGIGQVYDEVLKKLYTWIENIQKQVKSKEKLEALLNYSTLSFEVSKADEDSFYNDLEKKQIAEKILSLKSHIHKNYSVNKKDLDLINEKLDDLILKVDKMNKFDFQSIFIGVVVNIASSILYDSSGSFMTIVGNFFNRKLLS